MREQIAGAVLAGVCTLTVACSTTVNGKAVAADNAGPASPNAVTVSALNGLLLDVSQINSALSATSMKVWFNATGMWDWSASVSDTTCLPIDGPAQAKVYADTGWIGVRGQRLDDSIDDSMKRNHYAIQAVVGFPSAQDASAFYDASTQSWPTCSRRRYSDSNPGAPDTVWTVAGVTNANGMLGTSQAQEGGDGWICQRALTVRNNVAIDIVTCGYSQTGPVAIDIASQIAAKVPKQ
ncbi:sensor domain-containing protein [Mycobacterium haemophilum]|uniref:PknH-like extracellular domain-containing protein n=1 Tax=Mycobacterium haemophilum TaxID=29311 RepID=A0A0I9U6U5_9MYCO|nr:sensor domain-containing protein [Mycobacterium haemophilum]KLO25729.1 hypothetical protein ABH39_19200 [Mycobacterium haemophilum]KLO34242.1 hypothetical protein ABH38_19445 [Mycobacterium haemophilum]KLO36510.1 hypothetical protein ABH37_19520 [Mycobacterium haemophilum]KLO44712.1 hypothetical protein ABH36_19315 [Mycobacterium haemophilum]